MRPSPDAAYAIAKDLDRTYPGAYDAVAFGGEPAIGTPAHQHTTRHAHCCAAGHPFFESRSGIASLQRVLSAFAVHNPEIGYAQSLNFGEHHK